MRKTLFFFLLSMLATVMQAENYPYRSDFLWVTNPDHADWLYKTGEKAQVEVELYHYGMPYNGTVTYEVAPDMLKATESGTVEMKNGKAIINVGTRETPGFKDLRMEATIDGIKTKHHMKVGYDVDGIQPYTKEPKDFMKFWQKALAEARKTPITYTRELAKEYCTDKIDCWLIKLQTDKDHYIYAYLTMPKNAKAGSLPAVLCPPGAGVKTIKEPLRHKYYAENGIIRLEAEIHGMHPKSTAAEFQHRADSLGKGLPGAYIGRDADNMDKYYMKRVYIAMVRCLDFLTQLPEWDGKDLAVQGGSQGGALAIIASALDNRVTACCANHPALTDMAGYAEEGRTGGYPHFKPEFLTPQVQKTLQYYDVINFAHHVKCPTRLTWGYNDSTCPPTTSYAAMHSLPNVKSVVLTPINEHWTSDNMEKQHCDWIMSVFGMPNAGNAIKSK